MSDPSRPDKPPVSDQEREELSAYLDQELDAASTDAVTEALSRRPEVRHEAESLRKTWDLLDYLPRPTAPASFTEHTMTQLESTKGLLLRQGVRWRRYAIAGWVACVLVAAAFGFWLTYSGGSPEVVEVETPVTDVIPTVDPSPLRPPPRKERLETKNWQKLQREAIQKRNEKFQHEIRQLFIALRPRVTPEEFKELQAAGQKGGIVYLQLIFDLARKYRIEVDQIAEIAAKEAAARGSAEKVPTASVPAKSKK